MVPIAALTQIMDVEIVSLRIVIRQYSCFQTDFCWNFLKRNRKNIIYKDMGILKTIMWKLPKGEKVKRIN